MNYIYYPYYFFLQQSFLHMVVLTLRCNYICDYCHASSAGLAAFNTDMNFEIAKNVLDKIF